MTESVVLMSTRFGQVGLMLSGSQIDNILVGGPADVFNRKAPEGGKLLRGDTILKVRIVISCFVLLLVVMGRCWGRLRARPFRG